MDQIRISGTEPSLNIPKLACLIRYSNGMACFLNGGHWHENPFDVSLIKYACMSSAMQSGQVQAR